MINTIYGDRKKQIYEIYIYIGIHGLGIKTAKLFTGNELHSEKNVDISV